MINYIEKGAGLHEAIKNAGYDLRQVNGVWVSTNDTEVQLLIDNYDYLTAQKLEKIAELKAEGLSRIQTVYPAIVDFEMMLLIRDVILGIAPAARQLSADLSLVSGIYNAGKNAISQIQSLTLIDDVVNYDVVNDPLWP